MEPQTKKKLFNSLDTRGCLLHYLEVPKQWKKTNSWPFLSGSKRAERASKCCMARWIYTLSPRLTNFKTCPIQRALKFTLLGLWSLHGLRKLGLPWSGSSEQRPCIVFIVKTLQSRLAQKQIPRIWKEGPLMLQSHSNMHFLLISPMLSWNAIMGKLSYSLGNIFS